MHFSFFFFAHVAGIGWRWHFSFFVSKAQQAADLDNTGKKKFRNSLCTRVAALLFLLYHSPSLCISSTYISLFLMVSKIDGL